MSVANGYEEGFTPVYAKGSAVIKNSFSCFSSNTKEKSKPIEEKTDFH